MGITTVLIVDDHSAIRDTLALFFDEQGFEALSAADAASALDALAGHHVDVAIVDAGLPDMSGVALIAEAHQLQPNLRFLLHTGDPELELPDALLALGMTTSQNVIRKPVPRMAVLIDAVRRILET